MAHFAQLNENNVVTRIIVVNNQTIDNLPFPESEPIGVEFCQSLYGANTNWAQTSYNANFRYNYAGANYTFDPFASSNGAFIPVKPYPSWIINTNTYKWEAPVPYPNDGKVYYWDESTLSWKLVEPQPK